MNKNRAIKIIGAGIVGAIIGSTIGIAGMGSAIAGTVPVGALLAYLMYLWTQDKNTEQVSEPLAAETDQTVAQEPWKDIEKAAHDAVPVLVRFLGASWNLLMKALVMIGVMPIFRRTPWLLAVLVVAMMALIPPIGIFFFIIGIVAMTQGIEAESDFMVRVQK